MRLSLFSPRTLSGKRHRRGDKHTIISAQCVTRLTIRDENECLFIAIETRARCLRVTLISTPNYQVVKYQILKLEANFQLTRGVIK